MSRSDEFPPPGERHRTHPSRTPRFYAAGTAPGSKQGQVSPDPVQPIRWRRVLAVGALLWALFYAAARVLAELVGMPYWVRWPLLWLVTAFVALWWVRPGWGRS